MNYPILLFNFERPPNPNFFYFTSLDLDNSAVLILKNKKILFTSAMNKYKVQNLKKDFEVYVADKKSIFQHLKNYIYNKKVGLDFNSISAAQLLKLKNKFKLKPKNISNFFLNLRMKKSEEEIYNIQRAVLITKRILNETKAEIKLNMSEIQICNLLKKKALDYNVALAFEPIVAVDSSSKNPHHIPTNKKLKKFCLVDFGVKYKNYCADLTRCFFFTKNSKEKQYYKTAKKIFFELVQKLPKSSNTKSFYKKTYKILKKYGWENIPHSIGHGIGLEVHEPPFFSKSLSYPIKTSMTVALEPAWYCKDFGVRFEENILVKKNGIEIF